MEVFVAVVIDRHIDPIVRVFSSSDRAIEWAQCEFYERMAHPDRISEMAIECYLWSARYGEEEDRAWVERRTLDEANPPASAVPS